MNANSPVAQPKTSVVDSKGDSAKLLSLLALAGGALAMPQSSNADIVFTDLSANPVQVGLLANTSYIINNLPGTAQLGFHVHTQQTAVSSSRFITGRQQAGYLRIKTLVSSFVMVNAGRVWSTVAGNATISGVGGGANYYVFGPASYNDKYLLFRFKDSTQAGNPLRYGWVELSLANSAGNTGHPLISVEGYAYDTTGAFLASGQVPEPSAPALLALGALTLGAKGLRSWRKNRQAGTKP
jgi:hypothetical protein